MRAWLAPFLSGSTELLPGSANDGTVQSPTGAGDLELRAARAIAGLATVFFVVCAAWEMFGPLLSGHYASSASVGIIAENMWRWGIAGPVWEYTAARPTPASYYCHHPWGIFWTQAVLSKLFGHHDFVCRLPPVLCSAITPPLLYGIGRDLWRPAAGAAAAVGFVVLPISLAFASFNALEVPVMAWSLLGVWGLVRMTRTWKRRYLVASVVGFTLALHADWPAYLLVGQLLAFGLFRGILGRASWSPSGRPRFAAWWALTATAAVLTLALYVTLFTRAGKLDDLLASYEMRSSGKPTPLADVLASRRLWIELSFTPVAIVIGKICAPLCLARAIVLRRELELVPLAVLVMAGIQYVLFRQGADIHVFWPHYFAAYFALALGALTATLSGIVAAISRRGPRFLGSAPPGLVALGLLGIPLSLVLRDAVPALAYARHTGGRFNEKGLLIHSDGPKVEFLRWLADRIPRDVIVDMHEGMKTNWAHLWALGGRVVSANRAPPHGPALDGRDVWIADTRFAYDEVQAALAAEFHVIAVGPFWSVRRSEVHAPIEAHSFEESEPSLLRWYFVSGTEPRRQIVPDPFLTWELRTHFGQAARPPLDPPRTLEHRRVEHNVALAMGDDGRAASLGRALEAELRPIGAKLEGGHELLGVKYEDGARPLLTIVLSAGGPMTGDVQLGVRSRVIAGAALSTTMADPVVREVGLPLGLSPRRWKPGFLYSAQIPIRKRPGTEVFSAYFTARTRGAVVPKRTDDALPEVEVLRLK